MTAVLTRQPLQSLPMSTSNRPTRRLSARLQEKEDAAATSLPNGYHAGQHSTKATSSSNPRANGSKRGADNGAAIAKKRKIEYDEDVDGFAFTRGKRKTRTSNSNATREAAPVKDEAQSQLRSKPETHKVELKDDGAEAGPKRNSRKKMSFSTPNVYEEKPVRRSRRTSGEDDQRDGSPRRKKKKAAEYEKASATVEPTTRQEKDDPAPPETEPRDIGVEQEGTKIALPFADTPVIRRNKAMREGRGSKGERRSSLGMRGRRASSLIDSGTSNALPHNEVQVVDFYKHIESEGLSEPRRMRQLLTWCATRALGERSNGNEFEDQSARLAARVIQEELLKDLSDRSEMSDWFSREDAPAPSIAKVVKPNPKNIQNSTKIQELEEQIKRLQSEKHSLENLTKPPEIPSIPPPSKASDTTKIDTTLLSPSDLALHQSLLEQPSTSSTVLNRLTSIVSSLGPTIDAFTDGVHHIGQYRDAAERVANKALSISAELLDERDRKALAKATGEEEKEKKVGRESLGGVLRGLSRLES